MKKLEDEKYTTVRTPFLLNTLDKVYTQFCSSLIFFDVLKTRLMGVHTRKYRVYLVVIFFYKFTKNIEKSLIYRIIVQKAFNVDTDE